MNNYSKNTELENIVYFNEDGVKCTEVFKDIPEYEGLYQVSDLGRIKSLSRIVLRNGKYPVKTKVKILSLKENRNGYMNINLFIDGNRKTKLVHQLVAVAFLNHDYKEFNIVVNHKNFIRNDNRPCNLECVTRRENTNLKHIKSSSEYTGVSWHKIKEKWSSNISIGRKKIHLGYFDNEKEASEYYENALIAINNGTEIQFKHTQYTSKYKNVHWNKKAKKWRGYINKKYIGVFSTELEAHIACEEYRNKLKNE